MQLALDLTEKTWGGARAGAGRPQSSDRVSHVKRVHKKDYPVHVTWNVLFGATTGGAASVI